MRMWKWIKEKLYGMYCFFVGIFRRKDRKLYRIQIDRHQDNPLLSPREEFHWESRCTFNPAVILGDDNRIHMLYRAIGDDGVSRVGYASSADGINFDDRSPYPVFFMSNPRGGVPKNKKKFSISMYPSGGSWGGCEDPRMVRIEKNIYLSFNAFDGWDFIRVGVSTINENDFFEKKWRWQKPLFISPSEEVHKNWVLFPEKIKGRFAILHSISPDVQIDYVKDLEDLDNGKIKIESRFTQKHDPDRWESRMRGAGPPPLKTSLGWLIFYHAHCKNEPNRYKLGAMLLDLEDPSKIIARSKSPLLTPDMWYENDWKPGIVYVCGTLIKDGNLFVYYGGGDKYICLATTPIDDFLKELIEHKDITFNTKKVPLN